MSRYIHVHTCSKDSEIFSQKFNRPSWYGNSLQNNNNSKWEKTSNNLAQLVQDGMFSGISLIYQRRMYIIYKLIFCEWQIYSDMIFFSFSMLNIILKHYPKILSKQWDKTPRNKYLPSPEVKGRRHTWRTPRRFVCISPLSTWGGIMILGLGVQADLVLRMLICGNHESTTFPSWLCLI